MLKSMTAYARAVLNNDLGRFTLEMQSVNRRHLDIVVQLPPHLSRFEVDIKKWAATAISRGHITIKIFAEKEKTTTLVAKPNVALGRQLKNAWKTLAEELECPFDESFLLSSLANFEPLIYFDSEIADESIYRDILRNLLNMALEKLNEMKRAEGKLLYGDFAMRIDKVKAWLERVASAAPQNVERVRQKLIKRLEELLPGQLGNEPAVAREVALYAEKSDITEELVRAEAHLSQFAKLMESSKAGIGKTLDFLMQEIIREVHTIGSKSADLEVSQLVISIKSEIERMREQVQNIE